VQYLAWAAAAAFVISFWGGLAYNLFAGWLLVLVYNRWSHGFFAASHVDAHYQPLTNHQIVFAMVAWTALVCTCWHGLRMLWTTPRQDTEAPSQREGPVAERVPVLAPAHRAAKSNRRMSLA
jgi:hypothetical protein